MREADGGRLGALDREVAAPVAGPPVGAAREGSLLAGGVGGLGARRGPGGCGGEDPVYVRGLRGLGVQVSYCSGDCWTLTCMLVLNVRLS